MSWHTTTARALAAQVQARTTTALAVAEHFIARVQAHNPALNALVQFHPDRVRAEAADVDQRLASGASLPLAGVPVTVKDNVWVAGYAQQQGSRVHDGFVAPRDAWVVARLKSLGAVVLGISNCSEFACKGNTVNLVYGATRHPMDRTLTPGGSSGGAAAAVAAGLGLLAIGTDAGGSTRRPAAHTGLVGLKPSPGLIPHPWGFAEPNYGLSVIGLLGRDVGDVAWLFDRLIAFDAADPSAPPLAVDLGVGELQPPPRALRIGWSPQLGCGFAVDADVAAALQARVDALRAQGWTITDADPAWPDGTREYPLIKLQHAGLHALYGRHLDAGHPPIDPDLAAQITLGAQVTAADVATALRLRERITSALATYFDRFDLLLTPTAPVTAWPVDQLGPAVIGGLPAGPRGHAAFTPLFNYAGVPAISVPAGMVRNLPVGMQVVAPRYEDARAMRFAAMLECAGG
ncbi:amidase [Pseudaquabacterium pictum]|uniref:Amidotransferase n=1 Tax=Pseudaquabacterium pictum TaxID=2315236 RepID=A0A480AYC8_9BURK|nr:amidase [Rubrivivax pictus]GCL63798.1 amidotransferase [Rubrivivax pictus]